MKLYLEPSQSIQRTLDQYPIDETIDLFLSPGIYHEKLRIKHHHLTIYGSGVDRTIITYADYAYKMHEDGLLFNTFRTFTVMILGNHVHLHDLTIENTCGSGFTIGQGVALSLLGTFTKLSNCKITGHQDTLFIGPLPRDLNDRYDHFLPLEERSDQITYHHLINTTIEGDVDFIFGSGSALFESCHVIATAKGYINAPSTYQTFPYGFVFWKSTITSQTQDDVYLARPWREHGAVMFIDCTFQGKFADKRYDAWDKKEMRFQETPYIPSDLSTELSKEEK
ncbi:MAG: pectinesterase family protein, partial [Acholeplasmataceae bacterium]|nr:pectinesterase family protein [Acholeplasmataceae bacterium]